ncbi:PEF-CTERM sorting domain-containing protein [Methanolobus sp. WCC1]|jgi:hypothetical protein|uniref:PEF-CTERM protein sorting domain-containing protein n=1 Tax=Methanolobus tindarius DSM 2278 TaxID=1090322 RepID=W9DT50_METTI|nr:PEF-CTERM sorting domain-containing protein [Methanolobus tindarius]ETA68805.1 hypothetical protein MettiDRAFT_2289 [Methanolobus tindarius DSM 2278]
MKYLENRILSGVFTKTLAAAFIIMMFVGISAAAPMTFFGEDAGLGESTPLSSWPNADAAKDDFLSHLNGVGVEDLESFKDGDEAPLTVDFGAAGTATLNGTGEIETNIGSGRYPISGDNFWEATGDFSIEFSEAQVAFGFYGVDVGDFDGQLTVVYEDETTQTLTIPHTTNAYGGAVIYYGFIDLDHPFTKITFDNTMPGYDYFGFDDFTIGTKEQVNNNNNEIPEFPTVAIPMAGIIGMMFLFQRRKE